MVYMHSLCCICSTYGEHAQHTYCEHAQHTYDDHALSTGSVVMEVPSLLCWKQWKTNTKWLLHCKYPSTESEYGDFFFHVSCMCIMTSPFNWPWKTTRKLLLNCQNPSTGSKDTVKLIFLSADVTVGLALKNYPKIPLDQKLWRCLFSCQLMCPVISPVMLIVLEFKDDRTLGKL